MKVADEVWVSTALLHREHPERERFSVAEIKQRWRQECGKQPVRTGFQIHLSSHCLANRPKDPATHRMLQDVGRGLRRLHRISDPCHGDRQNGKVRPDKWDLPAEYQTLVDWYDTVYSKPPSPPASAPAGINPVSLWQSHPESSLPAAWSGMQSATAFINSDGAVVIPENLRRELELDEGTRISIYREDDRLVLQPITEKFIHSLVGCCKGEDSLVEAREREHRLEK